MPLPPTESDRKRLSDHDLVIAILCLANSEGGEVWLGVEDDGTPTGLHPEPMGLGGLAGLVVGRGVPTLGGTRLRWWEMP